MKFGKQIALAALALGMAGSAYAQTVHEHEVGNGGGAWVCRNPRGAIQWIQLVDLFEAENEFRLTLENYSGTVPEILDRVRLRLLDADRDLYEALAPGIEALHGLEDAPPHVIQTAEVLREVDDSLYRVMPDPTARCPRGRIEYAQVVNFKHDGQVLVQSTLFQALSPTERAALVLHEAVYAYRRTALHDANSVTSRRLVGLLFSNLPASVLAERLEEILGATPRGMEFVRLPIGFEIQTTEVTQAQWVEVMGSNPSYFQQPEHCPVRPGDPNSYRLVNGVAMCPNHPVERVSYLDVEDFIRRLNPHPHPRLRIGGPSYIYRLPSDVEWEEAARAGSTTLYPWGDSDSPAVVARHAVYGGSYSQYTGYRAGQTAATGSKFANRWGLYDMYGNVMEWTSGVLAIGLHRYHGGGWASDARDLLRVASCNDIPRPIYMDLGFRLVRTRR